MAPTVVVMSAESPMRRARVSRAAARTGLGGDVAAEVDDGEAVIFQEHLHDVLADVMDVALHRGHNDGAIARGVGGSGGACGGLGVVADEIEAGFDGLGGGHELGQKEHALIVLLADDVENGHEDVVDDGQTVVGLQQLFGGPPPPACRGPPARIRLGGKRRRPRRRRFPLSGWDSRQGPPP